MNDRSGLFAEDGQIPLTVGKMFGKFKNIISLDTLYPNPPRRAYHLTNFFRKSA